MALAHGQKRSRSDKDNESTSHHHHRFHFVGSETPSDNRGSRALQLSRPDWQQDALDERGRKRFHGAFTGGFSAGYFNTVGSKEGFMPASFVSSRTNRAAPFTSDQKRREAYMDDEDLADAAATRTVQAVDASTLDAISAQESEGHDVFKSIFKSNVDTAATRAMQSMGWRSSKLSSMWTATADENSRRGAGYLVTGDVLGASEAKSKSSFSSPTLAQTASLQDNSRKAAPRSLPTADNSSDEDLADMGPKIAINRRGQDVKKTRKAVKPSPGITSANPLLASRPVFRPKSSVLLDQAVTTCHDDRPVQAGFEKVGKLQDEVRALLAAVRLNGIFDPPAIDPAWEASKTIQKPSAPAELNTASLKSPETRAALMGWDEPKKSVFDLMSPGARDKIAAALGREDLQQGRGQDFLNQTDAMPESSTLSQLRLIPKEAAISIRDRIKTGWILYRDDHDKQGRFTTFLDFCGQVRGDLPGAQNRLPGQYEALVQELREFASAATMFKPMTGVMASRFITAASAQHGSKQEHVLANGDPAHDAAKAGIYGPLTRRSFGFYPVSLVCKRFNIIQPPMPADCEQRDIHDAADPIAGGADMVPRGAVDESMNASIEGPRAVDKVFEAVFGDEA